MNNKQVDNFNTAVPQEKTYNGRNITFDIAKGIGIILIVLSHANCPAKSFICLFHVALFFIISGYFIKDYASDSVENVRVFIKKRIKSLYLPYIIMGGILILLNNFLININIYTINPQFLDGDLGNTFGLAKVYFPESIPLKLIYLILMQYCAQLAGATWFLKVLLFISICYVLLNYFAKKVIKQKPQMIIFVISLLSLLTGYVLHKIDFNLYSLGTICTSMFLLCMGACYKKLESKIVLNCKTFIISFIILAVCWVSNHSYLSIVQNNYGSVFRLLFTSAFGFVFILCISKFLSNSKLLSDILSYIGRNTIAILCLHFICFKLVTLLQVYAYNLPVYRLASFPIYLNTGLWWLAYTIAGITGPLVLYYFYHLTIRKLLVKNDKSI